MSYIVIKVSNGAKIRNRYNQVHSYKIPKLAFTGCVRSLSTSDTINLAYAGRQLLTEG